MRLAPFAAIWLMLLVPALAGAQDFRVETDVFVGKQKEPAAQYLTVFKGGFVYDFQLGAPNEVTIYDVQRGRFVLLDPSRGVKTEILNDELLKLTADLQVQALSSTNADVQFLGNPQFTLAVDEKEQRVKLESAKLIYSAKGSKPRNNDQSIVRRYTHFADGYARINGLRLGNIPPFARLQLNEQLLHRGWIPVEVERTVAAQVPREKQMSVRTTHLFSWQVLRTDENRIGRADNQLQTLKVVTLGEYLQWPVGVAKAQ